MKTTKFVALAVLLILPGTYLTAQAHEHPKTTEQLSKAEHPSTTELANIEGGIIAVASESGEFKTFITAVQAAGLENELQGKGPFTIFAPTDAAFAKLPDGMMEDLLKPANKAQLAGLLANHVVPGKIMTADIKTMKATNVSGQDLNIQVDGDVVTVDNCRVVQPDLVATNGVIHAIDAVIIPAPPLEKAASEAPKDHPAH